MGVARRTGTVTYLRMYRGPRALSGTRSGTLRNDSGAVLGTAVFPAVRVAGWQSARLNHPVSVFMGSRITVCALSPNGHFANFTKPSSVGVVGGGHFFGIRSSIRKLVKGRWQTTVDLQHWNALGLIYQLAAPPGPVAMTPMPQIPAGAIDVRSFGAVGDGVHDDSDAIQRALYSLKPGDTLVFPAGRVFRHTAVTKNVDPWVPGWVLTVTTPNVRITGGGTLLGTAEASAAFNIKAAGVQVDHLTFRTAGVTHRGSTFEEMGLHIGPYAGVKVSDVSVENAPAAGVYINGASGFQLRRVRVIGSHADGVHMTGGSHDGAVDDVYVTRSGDDGVAIVSYQGEPVCQRIYVTGALITDQLWGRGVTVVGGDSIRYRNTIIDRSNAAAVYISSESEWNTQPVSRVEIDRAIITNANMQLAHSNRPIHGAVLLYNSSGTNKNTDITLHHMVIIGPPTGSGRISGVVGQFSHLWFHDNTQMGRDFPYYAQRVRYHNLRLSGSIWNGINSPTIKEW